MKQTINFKYNRKKVIFENLELEIPENKITVISEASIFLIK